MKSGEGLMRPGPINEDLHDSLPGANRSHYLDIKNRKHAL